MSRIAIMGMDKAYVLLYLYNYAIYSKKQHASPLAMKILIALNGHGSIEKANELLKIQTRFDFVDLGTGLRRVSVNIGSFEFDATEYDHLYGEGQALRAINAARQAYIEYLPNNSLDRGGILKTSSPVIFKRRPNSLLPTKLEKSLEHGVELKSKI